MWTDYLVDKEVHAVDANAWVMLGALDGAVDGDLLIPPDTKATDGVAGLIEHRG